MSRSTSRTSARPAAREEVEVRARAQGFLESIDFVEGTLVRQGQLLYTIDPRELQAQLAQAQGSLARAEAAYVRATQDVERSRPLVEQNALPRQDLETALANQSANHRPTQPRVSCRPALIASENGAVVIYTDEPLPILFIITSGRPA